MCHEFVAKLSVTCHCRVLHTSLYLFSPARGIWRFAKTLPKYSDQSRGCACLVCCEKKKLARFPISVDSSTLRANFFVLRRSIG